MRNICLFFVVSVSIVVQASLAAPARSLSSIEKLFLDGRYESVISDSSALIDSGTGRKDELYYLKGLSELKMNRFANARGSFNYIISGYSRSKKVFDASLGLGDSYFLEGDNIKALEVYSDMETKYDSDKNIAVVYSRLSSCYARMGVRDKSEYYFQMVQRKAPLSFEAKSAPAQASQPIAHSQISADKMPAQGRIPASRFSVQVGSFKNKRNADKLSKKLVGGGYASYVERPGYPGDDYYRVKVGGVSSKDDASNIASRLKADGYRTKICTDDSCQ